MINQVDRLTTLTVLTIISEEKGVDSGIQIVTETEPGNHRILPTVLVEEPEDMTPTTSADNAVTSSTHITPHLETLDSIHRIAKSGTRDKQSYGSAQIGELTQLDT